MPRSNVTPIIRKGTGTVRDTGEVIDIEMPDVVVSKKRRKRRVFALVDIEATSKLELTGSQWRVLMKLIAAINRETNESRITVNEIADQLGVAASSVSRTLAELRARNIVFTEGHGRHRVNMHIAYRGSADEWDMASALEPMPVWDR